MRIHTTVFSTIIALLLGGLLQFWITKSLDQRKHRQNLRTQAYIDFMHTQMEEEKLRGKNTSYESFPHEFRTRQLSAKARIVMYGSKEVVNAIADFYRKELGYYTVTEEELIRNWIVIFQSMRKESTGWGDQISDTAIGMFMFGKTLEKQEGKAKE